MSNQSEYSTVALRALIAAKVLSALDQSRSKAVVLERVARAAGATRWYLISDGEQFATLAGKLSPGSSVSFYFDGRLGPSIYTDEVAESIISLAKQYGDAVVGIVGKDDLTVEVDFVADEAQLTSFMARRGTNEQVVHGAFPGRDNDGVRAITVDLPDVDGVVRAHPH